MQMSYHDRLVHNPSYWPILWLIGVDRHESSSKSDGHPERGESSMWKWPCLKRDNLVCSIISPMAFWKVQMVLTTSDALTHLFISFFSTWRSIFSFTNRLHNVCTSSKTIQLKKFWHMSNSWFIVVYVIYLCWYFHTHCQFFPYHNRLFHKLHVCVKLYYISE